MRPGWYPDPHDRRFEIYWDGYVWRDRRMQAYRAQTNPSSVPGVLLLVGSVVLMVVIGVVAVIVFSMRDEDSYQAGYSVGRELGRERWAATSADVCSYGYVSTVVDDRYDRSDFIDGCEDALEDYGM